MAPKMNETKRFAVKGVKEVAAGLAIAALLLVPSAGTLAAPKSPPRPGIIVLHQDDSESRIVPRGSDDEDVAEEEPAFDEESSEDDFDWDEASEEDDMTFGEEDADEEGDADSEEDAAEYEEENGERSFVRFSGISRSSANLEPNQWMGVMDGRLVEPFAVTPAPYRLAIDEIGVSAEITKREIVNGEMQTPADEHEVTWYKETAKPGQKGNMVFSGHLNWYGVPEAVFYRINELEKGDLITVTGEDGQEYTYKVKWVKLVDIENADLDELVGETKKASLTLITCGGQWEADLGQYGHRTVVRAELVTD